MHRSPAISHNVLRSRWHGCLLLGTWLAALGLLIYFSVSQGTTLLPPMLFAVWLLCGWISMRAWRTSAAGLLQWDGEHWHWIQNAEGQICHVHMVWDFQQVLLVRKTVAEAPGQWLWLESGGSMLQWDALRRALVSASTGFTEPSPTNDLEGQR